jgi:hypothetical protein
LNAVVASDRRVASVMVTRCNVTVSCNHWWVRDVVFRTPTGVSMFVIRFDTVGTSPI